MLFVVWIRFIVVVTTILIILPVVASINENDEIDRMTSVVTTTTHPLDDHLMLHHFASTTSTQDEAKIIVNELSKTDATTCICVTATEQTNGRGTSGRHWWGAKGNVFVTIGIPHERWNNQITLLPLQVGTLVAQHVQQLLQQCTASPKGNVTVKWPNDVLVNEEKIAGILIESHLNWFLIGIGVNLQYAPSVPIDGPNRGRSSTSLVNHCPALVTTADAHTVDTDAAQESGVALAFALHQWLLKEDITTTATTNESILETWKQFIDWDMKYQMRDDNGDENNLVKITNVLSDGRIEVQNTNEETRVLVADYFL